MNDYPNPNDGLYFYDIDEEDGPWFEFVKKINKTLSVHIDDWVFIGKVGEEFPYKQFGAPSDAKEAIAQFVVENKLCSKTLEEILILMKLSQP